MIQRLLIILTLCSAAFGQITVHGISEVGDTSANSHTLQTVGAVAGDTIVLQLGTQGIGCPVTGATWSAGTATITTSGTGCVSVSNGTLICLGDTNPIGYNGCFPSTGSTGTTVSYALAGNPGTYVSSGGLYAGSVAPTDNAGNTYVEITGAQSWAYAHTYYAQNISLAAGSQPTITCALPTGFSGITCATVTVAGLLSSGNPVDQVAADFTHGLSTSLSFSTPAIGGTVSPEFIWAFAIINSVTGNATHTACGAPAFTNFDFGNHDGMGGYPPAYFVTSSTGTYCAGLLQNSSQAYWPITISFKGAGAVANNATTHGGKIIMGGKFITQ